MPMLGDWIERPRTIDAAEFLLGNLPIANHPRISFGFLKPMIQRSFLVRHGLHYDPALRFAEDFDLYLRALLAGARFVLSAETGYRYTVRAGSATDRHTAKDLLRLKAVDRRLVRKLTLGSEPNLRAALDRHLESIDRRLLWRLFTDRLKARMWRPALRLPLSSLRSLRLLSLELAKALPRIIRKRVPMLAPSNFYLKRMIISTR